MRKCLQGRPFNISQAHFHCNYLFLKQDCFDLDLETEKEKTNTFSDVHNPHTTFALLRVAHVYNKYTRDGLTFDFFPNTHHWLLFFGYFENEPEPS